MADATAPPPGPAPPVPARRKGSRRLVVVLILLAAAYLGGFVPEWRTAREQALAREKAEQALTITRMVKDLGSAVVDARRGQYEPARLEASAFFTAARFELDAGGKSALSKQQRDALAPVLGPRDELITLLARSDPASAERLSALYVAVRKILGV